MKVLITGATGYIGKEIVSELSDGDFEIYRLGNSKLNAASNDKNCFKIDITKIEEIRKLDALQEMDGLIHTAGLAHQFKDIEKEKFQQTNVEGTRNVLNSAVRLKVKHFILISSTSVYGIEKSASGKIKVFDEDSICHPATFYAESKLAAEKVAIEICSANNINLTIFRPAPVIGEGSAGNVARLIESIDRRRFIWIGGGENYKSLIYKRDVARACRKILTDKKNKIEIFNLAAAPVTMRTFVETAAKSLGRNIPGLAIPANLTETVFGINRKFLKIAKIEKLSQTVGKWLSDDVYSAQKFENEYGFQPEISVLDGLRQQVERYKQQKNLAGD